ncbi:MAG: DUF4149 domain-containing protein [Polaromonas sp.]|uniref:DUF4149 domain-containing protein n=1 Tax=Polaromonas sp. TaxID=1869339 RepID=UPI0025ED2BBD|nr:DUF4149 domain-containing protein [Polaromonas sp.]MBI2724866.1 DUF4149 domain-containing protein [Polaromonas sp.]
MRRSLPIIAAALWWGSLTTLGFLVVPMLFANLATPAMAGAMAAKLFSAQTWVSIACGFLLLLALNRKDPDTGALKVPTVMKFIVAGLLLAALVEFGVSPRIVSARSDGSNLKLWHGLGTAMYVLQWLCAGATLWLLSRSSPQAASSQS